MDNERIKECNERILFALSAFINNCPDAIDSDVVQDTMRDCGVDSEKAYRILLSGALELYDDRYMMRNYMDHIVKKLDSGKYTSNPYYKNIILTDEISADDWHIETGRYAPYELFVYNDLKTDSDGHILPQVGFFEKEFTFPQILQNGREWMMITPNEIETMTYPIARAHGDVLTYGLGLGYFAYMAALKDEVTSVTVAETDKTVISVFNEHILPQFPHPEKIKTVCCDALFFASDLKTARQKKYDFVFADIWHDPSDGCDIYRILKALERSDTEYAYWIEDTLKCYL